MLLIQATLPAHAEPTTEVAYPRAQADGYAARLAWNVRRID